MKIDKTTVYTLTEEEVKTAIYSAFTNKVKGIFNAKDIKLMCNYVESYEDADFWAELTIKETDET